MHVAQVQAQVQAQVAQCSFTQWFQFENVQINTKHTVQGNTLLHTI